MGEKRATDHLEPSAKKRVADRHITKDDVDEESEEEPFPSGEFQRATKEILNKRKIIKARRGGGAPSSTSPPNPFSSITLAPPSAVEQSTVVASGATTQEQEEKEKEQQQQQKPAGGFGSLSMQGGLLFGGAARGGFGSLAANASAPSFGTSSSGAPGNIFSTIPPVAASGKAGNIGDQASNATPVFGTTHGTTPSPEVAKLLQEPNEPARETGEENETVAFSCDGALFEFPQTTKMWKEKGRGEIRVLISKETGQGRIVMRQKGNLRLILNANLWKEMQLNEMDGGRGASFAVVNHVVGAGQSQPQSQERKKTEEEEDTSQKKEGDSASLPELATFAVRFKGKDDLDAFVRAVDEHKLKS